jgi:hypothetical protein
MLVGGPRPKQAKPRRDASSLCAQVAPKFSSVGVRRIATVKERDNNQRQIEIGNGGTEEFLVSKPVEHLFPCKQMFHTKWCTPMLKGHPPTFRNGKCSRCGVNERRRGGRYCLECHRTYARAHRAEQRRLAAQNCENVTLSNCADVTCTYDNADMSNARHSP